MQAGRGGVVGGCFGAKGVWRRGEMDCGFPVRFGGGLAADEAAFPQRCGCACLAMRMVAGGVFCGCFGNGGVFFVIFGGVAVQ